MVVDLPFGSYQGNSKEALASAIRIMKESHAEAVKMEGGAEIRESIERVLFNASSGANADYGYRHLGCYACGELRRYFFKNESEAAYLTEHYRIVVLRVM